MKLHNELNEFMNMETGELVEGILNTKDMIQYDKEVKAERAKRAQAKEEYERKKDTNNALDFSFALMDNVKELVKDLDKSDRTKRTYQGYILQLQTYTNYKNVLYLYQQAKKPLNRSGIAKVLEVSARNARGFINSMLELGVLEEVTTGNGKGFRMNKKYCFRGNRNSKSKLVKVFNKNVREVYQDNAPADVSFLYSILPYISQKDNVLTFNPYERDPSKLDVMTTQDIADVTDISKNAVTKKKNRMTFNGYAVFKTEIKNGMYNFVVNPLVFYRKKYEPSDTLVRSFLIEGKEQ